MRWLYRLVDIGGRTSIIRFSATFAYAMKMLARRGSAGFLRSSKHSRRRHRLALRL